MIKKPNTYYENNPLKLKSAFDLAALWHSPMAKHVPGGWMIGMTGPNHQVSYWIMIH